MKKSPLAQRMAARAAGALIAAALVTQVTPAAFAAVGNAQGVDWWYDSETKSSTTQAGTSLDVLEVTGDDDDLVYLDVHQDGKQIASHLTFPLKDLRSTDDGGAKVLSIVLSQGISQGSTYEIVAYTDRGDAMGSAVYSGTLEQVYGSFDGKVSPIAVTSAGLGSFAPHKTYVSDGKTYELASKTPIADAEGRTVYEYQLPTNAPTSVDGAVRFVDAATGSLIREDEYTLKKSEGNKIVDIPETFKEGGKTYRTLFLKGSAVLSYSGTNVVTVNCREQSVDSGYFMANINYYDEDGTEIALGSSRGSLVHQVPVVKATTYTPPRYIYIGRGDEVVSYELSEANAALDTDGALHLEPGDAGTGQSAPGNRTVDDGGADGVATYALYYKRLDEEKQSTWTIFLRDGTPLKESEGKLHSTSDRKPLGVLACTWTSEGGFAWELDGEPVSADDLPVDIVSEDLDLRTVVVRPKQTVTLDGTSYDVMGSMSDREITHVFSMGDVLPVEDIYYRPSDDNTPDEPYEVTINYVNIANSETIKSLKKASTPDASEDLKISLEETFTEDGVEWVIIKGQGDALYHNYYSRNKVYTVYYRDVNDDLNADAEVTDVKTVTPTRPATRVARATPLTVTSSTSTSDGTTTSSSSDDDKDKDKDKTDDGALTATDSTDANADDQTSMDGSDLRAVTTDDGTDLVNNDGTDVVTDSITDDDNPLAAPQGEGQEESSVSPMMLIGLAIAAIIAALIAFFLRRSRLGLGAAGADNDDIDSEL